MAWAQALLLAWAAPLALLQARLGAALHPSETAGLEAADGAGRRSIDGGGRHIMRRGADSGMAKPAEHGQSVAGSRASVRITSSGALEIEDFLGIAKNGAIRGTSGGASSGAVSNGTTAVQGTDSGESNGTVTIRGTDSGESNGTTVEDGGLIRDGITEIKFPPLTATEMEKLVANNDECLITTLPWDCYSKFGSYGVKVLHTETWEDMVKMDWLRPEWMAHPSVQGKRLFDLTLPGTHNSGTFDFVGEHEIVGTGLAAGIQNQELGFDKQLQLGVRAFDIRVAHNPDANLLYVSHGLLTVPLGQALSSIVIFLQQRQKEVIVIYAKTARTLMDQKYKERIIADELDNTRVSGQIVHEELLRYFGNMLATYNTLSRLPSSSSMENPTIADLVNLGIRVIYFWEGQQVICTSRRNCESTPGWTSPWYHSMSFGEPKPLGTRGEEGGPFAMEPACGISSWDVTGSSHAVTLVSNIKTWSLSLKQEMTRKRPMCFPDEGQVPDVHSPTIYYWADAITTFNADDLKAERHVLGNLRAIFTRGEAFSLKSTAERVNYLLLSWYLKEGARRMFTQPNVVSVDFAHPLLAHRLIEANQERQECGWAIVCKVTGSCYAMSQLKSPNGLTDECLSEPDAEAMLEAHAESHFLSLTAAVTLLVLSCCCCCCCTAIWGYFFRRRRKQAPPGAKAGAGAAAAAPAASALRAAAQATGARSPPKAYAAARRNPGGAAPREPSQQETF